MTPISSRPDAASTANRFAELNRRRRQLALHEMAARLVLAAAVCATAIIAGYLIGIATTTCERLPALVAEAQARAAW